MRGISTYIKREGVTCDLQRESESGVDALNNPVETWGSVGSVKAIRFYGRKADLARQVDTEYGNYEMDTPRFALPADAGVLDGDRLVYDGLVYELRTVHARRSHIDAKAKRVE